MNVWLWPTLATTKDVSRQESVHTHCMVPFVADVIEGMPIRVRFILMCTHNIEQCPVLILHHFDSVIMRFPSHDMTRFLFICCDGGLAPIQSLIKKLLPLAGLEGEHASSVWQGKYFSLWSGRGLNFSMRGRSMGLQKKKGTQYTDRAHIF